MLNRTIAQYKIVGKVGAGGMGEVYKAEDTLLRRWVALKILPEATQRDEQLKRRFLREARAASALNHPGIITIYEVLTEDDLDIIVMELVEGEPLSELIPEGGLPIERVRRLGLQIAEAVAAAHAAGVIHRDLKPANVMVLEGDRVKVLDFGLAKRSDIQSPDAPTTPTQTQREALTRLGAVLGTLQYMSPEQALGKPADARSDIFSLGVMLYEMVTGARPFEGDNAPSVLHHVAYSEPRPIRELRQDVPGEFLETVERALAKEPQDRFQGMSEFAEAIRPASPPAGRPVSWRRIWKSAAAAVALLAALVALPQTRSLLKGWLGGLAGPAVELTERDPTTLKQDQLLELGRSLLARYDLPGHPDRAIEAFQLAITRDPDYAPAYAGIGLARWRKYRLEKDPAVLSAAQASAERAVEIDPLFTGGRVALALIQIVAGLKEEARSNLDQVLLVDPANADAHRGLGDLAVAQGELPLAETHFHTALEHRPDDWELLLLLGYVQMRQAKYDEAELPLRRAIEVTPDNARAYRSLAASLHYQSKYSEAATVLQRALELQPRADVYTNLGTLYFFQGLYEQSITSFEKARELDANHYRTWANLADAYRWTAGREGDAADAYRRAIQLVSERIEQSPQDSHLRSNLALYLAKSGQAGEALAELDRLSELEEPDTLYRASVVCELSDQRTRALELLEKAVTRGYSRTEIEHDPELAKLRADVRYHQLISVLEAKS